MIFSNMAISKVGFTKMILARTLSLGRAPRTKMVFPSKWEMPSPLIPSEVTSVSITSFFCNSSITLLISRWCRAEARKEEPRTYLSGFHIR